MHTPSAHSQCTLIHCVCRYDIDPAGLGMLSPVHPLAVEHGLISVRLRFLEDLGR